MKNMIITVIFIISVIFFVRCDVNGPVEKPEKDNDLVGWWKEILDTISADGREYFWFIDSAKNTGGFWRQPRYAGFFNADSCLISDRNKYFLCSDTIWLIYRGGYFKDPNGIIVDYDDPDTSVALYRLSEKKDTLYFEKIDHPKSRYFPNCIWDGELIN